MAIWRREPQVDPGVIASIQARIDADPVVQRMRNGDGWRRVGGGRVADPDQLSKYIEQRYQLPSGYNVSNQGQVVYGNETGWLRKWVTGAAPVAGAAAAGAFLGPSAAAGGAAAGAGGAGGTLGAATAIPGLHAAVPGALTAGGNLAAGAGVASGVANAATGSGVASGLKGAIGRALTTGEGIGDLIRLAPALIGMAGGNDGYGDPRQDPNIQAGLAKQKARMDATDPAFDTLVNMAYGMSPTAYRPATAPAGYTQPTPSQGAYAAPMPRFGGG